MGADTRTERGRKSVSTNACAECGGFDIEWMYRCQTHKVDYCRGCACPYCAEDEADDYGDDGTAVSETAAREEC